MKHPVLAIQAEAGSHTTPAGLWLVTLKPAGFNDPGYRAANPKS